MFHSFDLPTWYTTTSRKTSTWSLNNIHGDINLTSIYNFAVVLASHALNHMHELHANTYELLTINNNTNNHWTLTENMLSNKNICKKDFFTTCWLGYNANIFHKSHSQYSLHISFSLKHTVHLHRYQPK